MWNVNPDRDKRRGGFQNRDLGKTQFDGDYGPEFGIDYARFSDPPNLEKDLRLKSLIEEELSHHDRFQKISLTVRNGFIILKGKVSSNEVVRDVSDFVKKIHGVVEIINQIDVDEKLL
jgi:hypothetical protein